MPWCSAEPARREEGGLLDDGVELELGLGEAEAEAGREVGVVSADREERGTGAADDRPSNDTGVEEE